MRRDNKNGNKTGGNRRLKTGEDNERRGKVV